MTEINLNANIAEFLYNTTPSAIFENLHYTIFVAVQKYYQFVWFLNIYLRNVVLKLREIIYKI